MGHCSAFLLFISIIYVSFSQKTAAQIADKVNEEHAWKIEEMKGKVEQMLSSSVTNRERGAQASAGAYEFCLFGDNVGKVVNPR